MYKYCYSYKSAICAKGLLTVEINVQVVHILLLSLVLITLVIREVKHDVNGRRQTAKITADFESFSSKP